jgi:tetratricopeptide (TPR) repeat protein
MAMTSLHLDNSSRKSAHRAHWRKWALIVGVVIAGYLGFGYFRNQRNYTIGHQAWQQADCTTAIAAYDKVINRDVFNGTRWFVNEAEGEYAQCRAFQYALEAERSGNLVEALYSYNAFVNTHPTSPLNEAVRQQAVALFETADTTALAANTTCASPGEFLANGLVPQPEVIMPILYHACGQLYTADENPYLAFTMYEMLLTEYADHALAKEAEVALLANPATCEKIAELEQPQPIADRAGFLPSVYLTCGQQFEDEKPSEAVAMYERFLADYPNDPRAETAQAGLARAMVAEARSSGADEIIAPSSRGTAPKGTTIVEIQNDAPHPLRIVFSGPKSLIVELAACDNGCIEVSSIMQSLSCQAKGPIGRYTLPPGEYDVVVTPINSDVRSFTGKWTLSDSNEYYQCFFITKWGL